MPREYKEEMLALLFHLPEHTDTRIFHVHQALTDEISLYARHTHKPITSVLKPTHTHLRLSTLPSRFYNVSTHFTNISHA